MNALVENKPKLSEHSLSYDMYCYRKLKNIVIVTPLAMRGKYIDTIGLIVA